MTSWYRCTSGAEDLESQDRMDTRVDRLYLPFSLMVRLANYADDESVSQSVSQSLLPSLPFLCHLSPPGPRDRLELFLLLEFVPSRVGQLG